MSRSVGLLDWSFFAEQKCPCALYVTPRFCCSSSNHAIWVGFVMALSNLQRWCTLGLTHDCDVSVCDEDYLVSSRYKMNVA